MSSFMRKATGTVKETRDKSIGDESMMSKNSRPSDIKDLIEEFLCADIVPKIKNNKRLLNYLCQDPKHCVILFTFILDPNNYEVSSNVILFWVSYSAVQDDLQKSGKVQSL